MFLFPCESTRIFSSIWIGPWGATYSLQIAVWWKGPLTHSSKTKTKTTKLSATNNSLSLHCPTKLHIVFAKSLALSTARQLPTERLFICAFLRSKILTNQMNNVRCNFISAEIQRMPLTRVAGIFSIAIPRIVCERISPLSVLFVCIFANGRSCASI